MPDHAYPLTFLREWICSPVLSILRSVIPGRAPVSDCFAKSPAEEQVYSSSSMDTLVIDVSSSDGENEIEVGQIESHAKSLEDSESNYRRISSRSAVGLNRDQETNFQCHTSPNVEEKTSAAQFSTSRFPLADIARENNGKINGREKATAGSQRGVVPQRNGHEQSDPLSGSQLDFVVMTDNGQEDNSRSEFGYHAAPALRTNPRKSDGTVDARWEVETRPSSGQNHSIPLPSFEATNVETLESDSDPDLDFLDEYDPMPPSPKTQKRILPSSLQNASKPISKPDLGSHRRPALLPPLKKHVEVEPGSFSEVNRNDTANGRWKVIHYNDRGKSEAKPSNEGINTRTLPATLDPTMYKTAPKASTEKSNTYQPPILHGLGRKGDDVVFIHENSATQRHLPSSIIGKPAYGRYATGSQIAGPSDTGNRPVIEMKPREHDERLIYQAALQDIAQPKCEADLPEGVLSVNLLRHQRIALAWMDKKETNSLHCSGGILADDQGLGKTISMIALIQKQMPQQIDFTSNHSRCIKSEALHLDEDDNGVPDHIGEDKQKHEENASTSYTLSSKSDAFDLDEGDGVPKEGKIRHSGGDNQKCKQIELTSNHSVRKSEALGLDEDDGPIPEAKKEKQDTEAFGFKRTPAVGAVMPSFYRGRPAAGTLVVCPASVLRQWARELDEKVTDSKRLSVLVYHGSTRTKDPAVLAKYDVVITTYSLVANEVPKQSPVDDDDCEQKNMEQYVLSSDFSTVRKRKKISGGGKKGKKKRKGSNDHFDSGSGPLARVRWFRVVLDEAQTIKNYRTQVARACCSLRAKRRWCLSGTPLQNAIDDLYSYFKFLKYDPYAVYPAFCSSIKYPISRDEKTGYKKLQAVLRTIMLRRTKGTVINGEPIIELPPKSVNLTKIDFSSGERDFYTRLEENSRNKFKEYDDAGTLKQNYASILVMLLRLRQACDHPRLVAESHLDFIGKTSLSMAKQLPREMLISLLNHLETSLAICSVCSDPPEDAVVAMCGHVFCFQCVSEHLTGDENVCPVTGCKDMLGTDSVFSRGTLESCISDELDLKSTTCSSGAPAEKSILLQSDYISSKIKAAMEILKSLCKINDSRSKVGSGGCDGSVMLPIETCNTIPACSYADSNLKIIADGPSNCQPGRPVKAIIFSQWTSMLDLIEISLNQSLIQYRRLDGSMSLVARDKAVKDFNTDPEVTVMIMSLKAGNLGLNMVAACHVILLDLWWNPTTEDQAIDRAHRIGQTLPVTVSRLTIKETVEERILDLQEKKRKMVSSAFGEDQAGRVASRLTVEDLRYLFMG